jgi:GNAT superfamily N-acetyltransferase
MLTLEPVKADDFEAMLVLRMDALRESLERLGRFDMARGRERLRAGFAPQHMQHIVSDGVRIGFFTLRPMQTPDQRQVLRLDHLYVRPGEQGQGVGAWVMERIKSQARQSKQSVTLAALKLSDANRFYLRHGFEVIEEQEFDIEYRWNPQHAGVHEGAA